MEVDLYKLLSDNSILAVFVLLAIGYLVGRIKIGKIELGSTTGVLLAGLLFGHLGFVADAKMGSFGFAIFIFCVGLQAGPSFFGVVLQDGAKYVALAAVVAVTACAIALFIGKAIGLEYGMSAGLLAGSLTSTPTLAGAQDALSSGLASLPDGVTEQEAAENISVGYAITYIFGTVGLILFIRYFPALLRIDLPAEAKALAKERGLGKKSTPSQAAEKTPIIRAYRIPKDTKIPEDHNIEQLVVARGKRFLPLRVRRDKEILEAVPDFKLKPGDVISVIAPLKAHQERDKTVGEEVLDPELLNYQITTKEIIVINREAVGKRIVDLDLTLKYGCFVRSVRRASIDLPADDHLVLNKGDRVSVTGEEERLDKLAEHIGRVEAEVTTTDLLTFAIGISAGVLLGMILIKIGGFSIGLGSAGGLLLSGILIGFLRSIYPTFGGVPPAARNVLMEFGLVMFMAGVGLRAGGGIVEGFLSAGPQLILAGVAVTLTPVIAGYFFGSKILKLNPALLFGSITGSMTSTPSLQIVTDAARSEIPALGYAGTYTFANVFLTFAGTLMMDL